jgi:hypothetical protein
MKLSFFVRHLKCQVPGCKNKATDFVFGGRGWFCDRHLDFVKSEFQDRLKDSLEKFGGKVKTK